MIMVTITHGLPGHNRGFPQGVPQGNFGRSPRGPKVTALKGRSQLNLAGGLDAHATRTLLIILSETKDIHL